VPVDEIQAASDHAHTASSQTNITNPHVTRDGAFDKQFLDLLDCWAFFWEELATHFASSGLGKLMAHQCLIITLLLMPPPTGRTIRLTSILNMVPVVLCLYTTVSGLESLVRLVLVH
jgi:hypothetical protein